MSRLRRYYSEGQIYFITCVTYNRGPILADHSDLVQKAFNFASNRAQCEIHAWVALPDHVHLMIEPANGDAAVFAQSFKQSFSMNFRKRTRSVGRVWQHRFWDHIIRDEADYQTHLNYIHFNPVKHGKAVAPVNYELSTFRDFVREGWYTADWCAFEGLPPGEFGE